MLLLYMVQQSVRYALVAAMKDSGKQTNANAFLVGNAWQKRWDPKQKQDHQSAKRWVPDDLWVGWSQYVRSIIGCWSMRRSGISTCRTRLNCGMLYRSQGHYLRKYWKIWNIIISLSRFGKAAMSPTPFSEIPCLRKYGNIWNFLISAVNGLESLWEGSMVANVLNRICHAEWWLRCAFHLL